MVRRSGLCLKKIRATNQVPRGTRAAPCRRSSSVTRPLRRSPSPPICLIWRNYHRVSPPTPLPFRGRSNASLWIVGPLSRAGISVHFERAVIEVSFPNREIDFTLNDETLLAARHHRGNVLRSLNETRCALITILKSFVPPLRDLALEIYKNNSFRFSYIFPSTYCPLVFSFIQWVLLIFGRQVLKLL